MRINILSWDVACAGLRKRKAKYLSGFTLLELIVSVAIVGVLASMVVPNYTEYIEKAKVVRATMDILTISKALTAYNYENGIYPQSLDEVGFGAFNDPWGSPYQYLNLKTMGKKAKPRKDRFVHPINSDYDLYSMGRDRKSNPALTAKASKDDVIRANNGAYIGLASKF